MSRYEEILPWPTYKPYTYRAKRWWFLFRDGYEILYDDSIIITTTLREGDVIDMVYMLNVAYTEGYMRAEFRASMK